MGFLDKAKAAASELAAKADEALTNVGAAGPSAGGKQAERFFRDLGVLTYLAESGRESDAAERVRVLDALRGIEAQGGIPSFALQTAPPPPPGAVAGGYAAPPPPPAAAGAAPPHGGSAPPPPPPAPSWAHPQQSTAQPPAPPPPAPAHPEPAAADHVAPAPPPPAPAAPAPTVPNPPAPVPPPPPPSWATAEPVGDEPG